jgi:acetyl esterase/lipase
MNNTFAVTLLAMLAVVYSNSATADPQFLRSSYDLGDPNGYCLDIPGFGPRLQKDAPINTHSCKYNRPGFSIDELFEVTASDHFRMPEYDLCLAADGREAGSSVYTIDCAATNVHAWTVHADGRVTPSDATGICLTLSSEKVYVNSSVANLTPNSTRSVSLESCTSERAQFQSWRWSDPSELDTLTANTLRAGMDAAMAASIRELGNTVRARETYALYAAESRMFSAADVVVSDEIDYGPEDGQRLQVYHGINRNHPQRAAPIMLLVHGGGFARGGLADFATAATHFAGLGYVVVNMTYPLLPKAAWPIGAESVASAVRWIRENAVDIKGNPDSIFVLGRSAGGAHVADFVFRPGIIEGDSLTIAGAILASPAISLNPERGSEGQLAYYGAAIEEWQNKQILGNIERTSIPVLIMVAEFDPDPIKTGTANLFRELLVDKGASPRIRQMRGHNHTSYTVAIGTADTQAAEEIIDFMHTR